MNKLIKFMFRLTNNLTLEVKKDREKLILIETIRLRRTKKVSL